MEALDVLYWIVLTPILVVTAVVSFVAGVGLDHAMRERRDKPPMVRVNTRPVPDDE